MSRKHQIIYKRDDTNCRMEARVYTIFRDERGLPICVTMNHYQSSIMAQNKPGRNRPLMYRSRIPEMFYGSAFADELYRVFSEAESSR